MIVDLVYASPVWALVIAALVPALLFAWACQAIVRRAVAREVLEGHSDLVNFSVTNIAVLYGVLLAFLAVVSWEGFSKASDDAGVEASLVASLYHDAEGLAQPLGADIDGHVRAYLAHVIAVEWPAQARGLRPADGSRPLAELHRHVARLSPTDSGDAVVMADMLHVLNQIDAARATRLEAQGGHVPGLIWSLIVAMGLLLIGSAALIPAARVGVQAAVLGSFVLALVLVVVMIVELDNPYRGALSVSVEPFERAMADIRAAVPSTHAD